MNRKSKDRANQFRDWEVQDLTLRFLYNDGNGETIIQDLLVSEAIKPGGKKDVEIIWEIPSDLAGPTIVRVTQIQTMNLVSILKIIMKQKLSFCNLICVRLYLKPIITTKTRFILLLVHNAGQEPANNVVVEFRRDSEEGEVLYTKNCCGD